MPNQFPPLSELKASRFANFKGKVEEDGARIGSLRGPNTLGEIMTIVSVGYDETTDMTRVGFAYTGMRMPNV